MAAGVPPPPLNSPSGSYYWLEWYTNLTNFLNGTNIPWSNLNFTGSNITDIQNRNHNDLQNIQGGFGGISPNHWHMAARGFVTNSGAGTGFPAGWTTAHPATGTYTVTHNLGTASPNLTAVGSSNTSAVCVQWIDLTNPNVITVHLANAAGAATDGNFSVIINT